MKKIIIFLVLIIMIPIVLVKPLKENYHSNSFYGIKENGKIRVKRNKTGEIQTIFMEDYVIGVVAGEMPVTFSKEALKAQAVASRTYALSKIDTKKDYDVDDGTNNQVYIDQNQMKERWKDNYENNYEYLKNIVQETKGKVIFYNNKVINALFFSTSNGYTENSEDVFSSSLPYLRSVESKWDAEESPVFKSTLEYDIKTFLFNLSLPYDEKINIKDVEKTNTGRIKSLVINNKKYSSKDIRRIFNLKSTSFDITQKDNKVIINVLGNGHGVGMSQYGANALAKKGYSYIEILKYYYKDCEIK